MRYFIRICAVLALGVSLGNAGVSGNAHLPARPADLHKNGVGVGANAGQSPSSSLSICSGGRRSGSRRYAFNRLDRRPGKSS